jgi:hypothetical protein
MSAKASETPANYSLDQVTRKRNSLRALYDSIGVDICACHLSTCATLLEYLQAIPRKCAEAHARGNLFVEPMYFFMPWMIFCDTILCAHEFGVIWNDSDFDDLLKERVDDELFDSLGVYFIEALESGFMESWDDFVLAETVRLLTEKKSNNSQ